MDERKFIYIVYKDKQLLVRQDIVNRLDSPILWNYKGLFGIIPLGVIKNLQKKPVRFCEFKWQEAYMVDSRIARLFLGEDENNQCTYSP